MFEEEIIYNYPDTAEDIEAPTEYPLPITVKDAKGCYLIDEENNSYLDFTSCRENHPLGYSKFNSNEASSFFDSELFISCDALKLEQEIKSLTGLEKVYLAPSHAECYKVLNCLVSKYINKVNQKKILVSSLSANRNNYAVTDAKVEFIPVNYDTIARSVFTKETGAVIVELSQIADDINIASDEYLGYLRSLCDKNNAILVLDISSIAPIRLVNSFLNYNTSIKPDILIFSKGLSQGIPFGAIAVSDKLCDCKYDESKSGSSVLAYKNALSLIDAYTRQNLADVVSSNSIYFEKRLDELAQTHISIVDVRSYGMLFEIIVDVSAYELVNGCFKHGIIIEAINSRTIKLSPPYIIGKEEIDKLIVTIDSLLDKLAPHDRLR